MKLPEVTPENVERYRRFLEVLGKKQLKRMAAQYPVFLTHEGERWSFISRRELDDYEARLRTRIQEVDGVLVTVWDALDDAY